MHKFRKHLQAYHLTLTNLNLKISKMIKKSFLKIKTTNNYRSLHKQNYDQKNQITCF